MTLIASLKYRGCPYYKFESCVILRLRVHMGCMCNGKYWPISVSTTLRKLKIILLRMILNSILGFTYGSLL